jgi:stearoyl-CoA desaturase (delta-9 desaturase)
MNKQAFTGLIIYPIFLIILTIKYCSKYSLGWQELQFMLLGYYVTNISVGIGLHRLWAHNSYKTNKVVEFVLALLSAGALQGPAIAWASDHNKHHTYTDQELDPHTPKKYSNKIKGFLWSHIGWMLFSKFSYKAIDTVTLKKLGGNKILIWQMRNYWKLVFFMHIVPPFLLGYALGGNIASGYKGFLFIALGRCLQQQATFCVNSMCHFFGEKTYYSGTARDIWWLALFLLGENWHNFHHAFPRDYRNGVKWYHFDVHKWIIYSMSKVGLAHDLEATPDFRIKAKVEETSRQKLSNIQSEWQSLGQMYEAFSANLYAKIAELESATLAESAALRNNLRKNLEELSSKTDRVIFDIKRIIDSPDLSSARLIKATYSNLQKWQHKFEGITRAFLNSRAQIY